MILFLAVTLPEKFSADFKFFQIQTSGKGFKKPTNVYPTEQSQGFLTFLNSVSVHPSDNLQPLPEELVQGFRAAALHRGQLCVFVFVRGLRRRRLQRLLPDAQTSVERSGNASYKLTRSVSRCSVYADHLFNYLFPNSAHISAQQTALLGFLPTTSCRGVI